MERQGQGVVNGEDDGLKNSRTEISTLPVTLMKIKAFPLMRVLTIGGMIELPLNGLKDWVRRFARLQRAERWTLTSAMFFTNRTARLTGLCMTISVSVILKVEMYFTLLHT